MKRKLVKRLLSLSVAGACLFTTLLAGCGKGQAENSGSDAAPETAKTQEASGTEEEAGAEVEAAGEKASLSIWAYWTNSDLYADQGDWEYWKNIEQACNVELEFLDSSGGKDALSLLAGTDDLPDIIIDYDWTFPGGVQKMLSEGSIIALNDLMDNGSMPNYKAYLETDEEVDKLIRYDEGLYAWAPMIRRPDSPLVFNGNMIRQDWLDDLGLSMPATVQEMEDVLVAFRDEKGCDSAFSFIYGDYHIKIGRAHV